MRPTPYVPPWALSDVETCRAYLERQDENDDPMISLMLRSVSARIERHCSRALKSRSYAAAVNTVVTNCVVTADSKNVTHASNGFAPVKEGQAMSGAGIATDTILEEKRSNAQIILSEFATAGGTVPLTFTTPDSRLRASGTGEFAMYLPEYPVDAFTAASYMEGGVAQSLDLTGADVRRNVGLVTLTRDAFPEGQENLLLTMVAGYKPGVDDDVLWILEQACLRWVQVEFQNQINQIGRKIETASQDGRRTRLSEEPIPRDVRYMLMPFVRYA